MSKISDFISDVLGKRRAEAEPVVKSTATTTAQASNTIPVEEKPLETSDSVYAELSTVRSQLKEIDSRTRIIAEKVRILRERSFMSSMNRVRWHGSPIGDDKGVQSALNRKANQRMVRVYESVKAELRLAEKELHAIQLQKQELERREYDLSGKFGAVSTIEALSKEIY